MRLKTIVFAWVVVLAASLNLALYVGGIDRSVPPGTAMLWVATGASVIAVLSSLRLRSGIGVIALAARLVVVVQLLAAAVTWSASNRHLGTGVMASTLSLTGGALLANAVSVTCLIVESLAACDHVA